MNDLKLITWEIKHFWFAYWSFHRLFYQHWQNSVVWNRLRVGIIYATLSDYIRGFGTKHCLDPLTIHDFVRCLVRKKHTFISCGSQPARLISGLSWNAANLWDSLYLHSKELRKWNIFSVLRLYNEGCDWLFSQNTYKPCFFWHKLYPIITRQVICANKTRQGTSQSLPCVTLLQFWGIVGKRSSELRLNVC